MTKRLQFIATLCKHRHDGQVSCGPRAPLAPEILVSVRSLKGIHGKDRQTMIEAA